MSPLHWYASVKNKNEWHKKQHREKLTERKKERNRLSGKLQPISAFYSSHTYLDAVNVNSKIVIWSSSWHFCLRKFVTHVKAHVVATKRNIRFIWSICLHCIWICICVSVLVFVFGLFVCVGDTSEIFIHSNTSSYRSKWIFFFLYSIAFSLTTIHFSLFVSFHFSKFQTIIHIRIHIGEFVCVGISCKFLL